jgi:hypothetical protein
MATDMDAVVAVLRRVADGDDAVLADPETFSEPENLSATCRKCAASCCFAA